MTYLLRIVRKLVLIREQKWYCTCLARLKKPLLLTYTRFLSWFNQYNWLIRLAEGIFLLIPALLLAILLGWIV